MTVWLWLQSIQLTLLKCQPWLSPPGLSMHSRFRAGFVWLSGRVLVQKRLLRPNSPQGLWIPDPAGIFFQICSWTLQHRCVCNLVARPQGKEKTVETGTKKISCHGKSLRASTQRKGRAQSPSLWAPAVSSLCSGQLPKQCFSDNIRSTPPTSLLCTPEGCQCECGFFSLRAMPGVQPLDNHALWQHSGRQDTCSLHWNAQILPCPAYCHKAHD